MIRIALVAAVSFAQPAFAQHIHNAGGLPTETGQSAFAAISEIVGILISNPDTDWRTVDIPALRNHLVDMDRVTMEADVSTSVEGRTVRFEVSGDETVALSIGRMAHAHAPMLAAAAGWTVDATPRQDGATFMITVPDDASLAEVLGLGFFGVMTLGAHHQAHHLGIATGAEPHRQ